MPRQHVMRFTSALIAPDREKIPDLEPQNPVANTKSLVPRNWKDVKQGLPGRELVEPNVVPVFRQFLRNIRYEAYSNLNKTLLST